MRSRTLEFIKHFNLTHGITFSEYADYVIRLKESTGVKHTTILSYRGLLKRINPGIGHLKITEIHPQQLNDLYRQLGKEGLRREGGKAVAKKDLRETLNQIWYLQFHVVCAKLLLSFI